MPQMTCQDTFAEAQLWRRSFPLEAGAYKLREARHRLFRMMNTVDAIGDSLRKPGSVRSGSALGPCCTTDDKADWIKKLPKKVAEMLGYDILPATAALAAEEGVAETDVAAELATARARADQLVDQCEAQRVRLKRGVKAEYPEIKSGQSELYVLLVDADHLAIRALELAERDQP